MVFLWCRAATNPDFRHTACFHIPPQTCFSSFDYSVRFCLQTPLVFTIPSVATRHIQMKPAKDGNLASPFNEKYLSACHSMFSIVTLGSVFQGLSFLSCKMTRKALPSLYCALSFHMVPWVTLVFLVVSIQLCGLHLFSPITVLWSSCRSSQPTASKGFLFAWSFIYLVTLFVFSLVPLAWGRLGQ